MTPARRKIIKKTLRIAQEGKCCYCELSMTETVSGLAHQAMDSETIEHLKRKEDGGGNGMDNLALSCRRCNVNRGTMNWAFYKQYIMDANALGVAA